MSKSAFSVQDAQSADFSAGGKLPYPAFAEVVWTVLLLLYIYNKKQRRSTTVLALSVKACRLCQLSQRESPWHNGKVSGTVQRRPLGGAGERSEPEGVASALPKAALQMSSPATTLLVKMGYRNARRRSDIPKFKIILPLMMPRAMRRAF